MKLPEQWLSSRWTRREYRICGSHIVPDQGSPLEEYDPFAFYFGRSRAEGGKSLYLDLVGLELRSDRAIEKFASRWGLLGLFYHPLIQIRYWRSGSNGNLADTGPTSGGMEMVARSPDLVQEELPPEWSCVKELGEWNASVIVLDEQLCRYVEQPLQMYSAPYLPDLENALSPASSRGSQEEIRDSRLLTIFDSSTRWDYLAEPLDQFRHAVEAFRDVYNECQNWRRSVEQNGYVDWLAGRLDVHVRHVHPILYFKPSEGETPCLTTVTMSRAEAGAGQWHQGWSFPSLLSAAYLMLQQDLAGNQNLHYCANETCGRPFVTHRSDARYCSPYCKNAQQQRMHRRAKRGR